MKKNIKSLFAVWIAIVSAFSFAAPTCHYVAENTVINIEGWAIDFREPIDQAARAHNYLPTTDLNEAEYQLSMAYQQLDGGFLNKAQVQFHWVELKSGFTKDFHVASKSCLGQLCSIYDFRTAALKAIRDFNAKLPDCD